MSKTTNAHSLSKTKSASKLDSETQISSPIEGGASNKKKQKFQIGRFKTWADCYDTEVIGTVDGERCGGPSPTVPDKSLTIRDMVKRLAQGLNENQIQGTKPLDTAQYFTDDEDHPFAGLNLRKLDPAQLEQVRDTIKKKVLQAQEKAFKENQERQKKLQDEHLELVVQQRLEALKNAQSQIQTTQTTS